MEEIKGSSLELHLDEVLGLTLFSVCFFYATENLAAVLTACR